MSLPVSLSAISPNTVPAVSTPSTAAPAQLIAKAGEAIVDAYRRYDAVRMLGSRLNGLPESAPLPAGVQVKTVKIAFEIDGAHWTVEVGPIIRVGDLARLLSSSIEDLVNKIRNEAHTARSNAEMIEEVCNRAVYNANTRQIGGAV